MWTLVAEMIQGVCEFLRSMVLAKSCWSIRPIRKRESTFQSTARLVLKVASRRRESCWLVLLGVVSIFSSCVQFSCPESKLVALLELMWPTHSLLAIVHILFAFSLFPFLPIASSQAKSFYSKRISVGFLSRSLAFSVQCPIHSVRIVSFNCEHSDCGCVWSN